MPDGPDHNTPSSNEIKLIIDNSNLEMEARITKSLGETLVEQNRTYMVEIVASAAKLGALEKTIEVHALKIKGFTGLVATVSSITGALGGLVGFLISQLVNIGKGA